MTNLEIIEKTNKLKHQYNNNKEYVEKNSHTINLLNKLKLYFQLKDNKINSQKKKVLLLSTFLAPISFVLFPFVLPISVTLLVLSVLGIVRFLFLNYADKKFKRCLEIFDNHLNSVNLKQLSYIEQQEFIMSKIIALENEIPDEIAKSLSKIDSDSNEPVNDIELTI